jgi:hypothetical protein
VAERYWTVEEANAALRRVEAAVTRAQAALRDAGDAARRVRSNGHGAAASSDDGARVVETVVEELAAEGIVLRDLERGLIDFPAQAPSGREYWLCWLVGEPAVTWWHWPEDGFAGRTPLAEPPT